MATHPTSARIKSREERAEARRVSLEMEKTIEEMSANGLSPQQISMLTKISATRLYNRYRESMMKGGARRTNEVAEVAYQMAIGGRDFASADFRKADASMSKFWLERMGGPAWAPPKEDEDGPDLSRLTVAQLIELERALRPLAKSSVVIDGAVSVVQRSESRERSGGVIEAGDGGDASGGGRDGGGDAGTGEG